MKQGFEELGHQEYSALQALFSMTTPTRIGLADTLGLSLLKTSSILTELEKHEFIIKAGKLQNKTGRPSIIYDLNASRFYSLGVSVDSSSLRIIAVDASKAIIHKEQIPLEEANDPHHYVDILVEQLDTSITRVLSDFKNQGKCICSITLALAGITDEEQGIWLLGLQVGGVRDIPLAEIMQERLGVPVFIEDKARLLAFYENTNGHGKKAENFILLYIGLGLGAGIVIGNKLYRGEQGISGEIGHIAHGNNNYRCSCGNVGCLETVVSKPGIIRVIRERLHEGVISSLQEYTKPGAPELTIEAILEAANNGDRLAQSTLFDIGEFIGDACSIIIKLFNPSKVIISGYGAVFKEFFREPVNQVISRKVIPIMTEKYETVYVDYSPYDEAYGAALFALYRYFGMNVKLLKRQ
jgi:predicted NBD/HSP70 family sugar kinase